MLSISFLISFNGAVNIFKFSDSKVCIDSETEVSISPKFCFPGKSEIAETP